MFTWDIDPILIRSPVEIRYYGLLLALTLFMGFYFWRWQMRRGGHSEELAQSFVIYGVIAVLGGARLGHCIFYEPGRCFNPITTLFKFWEGGLSSHGATLGLILALVLFARRKKLPLAEVTDRFSFSAALGATLVRVANFVNSEIVGRPTNGKWGIRFPVFDKLPAAQCPLRHPSQLYEVALGLIVLGTLLVVDRRYGERRRQGLLSALFLIIYFAGRFVVEFFKARQTLSESSFLTMGQYLSIPLFFAGVIWLYKVLKSEVQPIVATQATATAVSRPARRKRQKKGKKGR